MYVPTVPKIRHKVGTQSDTHTFLGNFGIMHFMYVYSKKKNKIYNTKYLFVYFM